MRAEMLKQSGGQVWSAEAEASPRLVAFKRQRDQVFVKDAPNYRFAMLCLIYTVSPKK